ncbi:MAG TPA: zinc-dependent metalloprotease [Acidobacteriota bacterium]|nr:zinc-dependent metalloprotease [Acidobacteriota bacterium]
MGYIRAKTALAIAALMLFAATGLSQEAIPSISAQTEGMEKHEGFFTFYWDAAGGRIWLEIGNWDEEFLYVTSMPWGVGSNDIGLDRGQLTGEHVVAFSRIGPKVLMLERNYGFRADGADEAVARTVEQSFARSVIWGAAVAAEEDGRVLVDATDLLLSDAHGVSSRLQRAGQGSYQVDQSRSAMFLPRTKSFPDNSEFEAVLTFAGEPQNRLIGSVTPSPAAVTVHQHHSLLRLPDPGYEPRRFDPRSSFGSMSYMDPTAPFDRPLVMRFINRHRLQKKDPEAEVSEAVEPIVYYVDPGIPEPVKSAVIEGAGWWNEAFEAAGYRNAWQVRELPPDADPMDARYNLIQWVHRSTRGWSYGGSVSDPRTGEIIKGHVTLGSQRIRQDYLIAVAMSAPYEEGSEAAAEAREMALQRIRQLSAHEVGHTLGLMHNYASNFNERSSVMDYPHPLLRLRDDGTIDFSEAYTDGIGEWDKVAIAYGYQDFPEGADEDAELDRILTQAFDRGLLFISDADSRPPGSAHPYSHLWDNGLDPVIELERVLRLRQAALDRFSENNIRQAEPMCTLEEVLVPLYLFHRYQTVAAAKVLGGLNYSYAMRGDGRLLTEMIDGETQRRALEALLETISTETLTLPERIVAMIPPRAPGYQRGGGEIFPRRTGVTFDPLSAAETAAGMTLELIFNPERASRLVEFHARDNSLPGLEEVLDRVLEAAFAREPGEALEAEVTQLVRRLAVRRIMALAADGAASDQARAIALFKLKELAGRLDEVLGQHEDTGVKAHIFAMIKEIELFLDDPRPEKIPAPPAPPPGEPIG